MTEIAYATETGTVRYVLFRRSEDPAVDTLEVYDDGVYDSFREAESAAQEAWGDGEDVLVGEVKEVSWERPLCVYMTYAGSRHVDPEPPEYCENTAELGSEYCAGHAEAE